MRLLSPVLLEGFPRENVLIALPFRGVLLLLLPLGEKPIPLPPLTVFWNRGLGISHHHQPLMIK
jgi:hypothetical protein